VTYVFSQRLYEKRLELLVALARLGLADTVLNEVVIVLLTDSDGSYHWHLALRVRMELPSSREGWTNTLSTFIEPREDPLRLSEEASSILTLMLEFAYALINSDIQLSPKTTIRQIYKAALLFDESVRDRIE